MNIVYVYADSKIEWNSSEWRCAVPARAIKKTQRHSAVLIDMESFAKNTPEAKKICNDCDLIVIQRNLFGPVLKTIQYWKARDKAVIVDFDDAYNLMEPGICNYEFWVLGEQTGKGSDQQECITKLDPTPLAQFKLGLRLVHAATVPSTALANDWSEYAPFYYLPNFIEVERYSQALPQAHDNVIIGWGGSLSHLQSFQGSGILTALKNVCERRPKAKVMICGDKRVYNLLPLPEDQKIYQPYVEAADWPHQLAKFDIGLAPLCGPYDQRRSWIKVLEYLVMKIPWVASEGPAYHALRSYGWLVPNSATSWERILIDIVDHLDEYKQEAGRDPFLFGISQSVDDNVEKIIMTYNQIMEKTLV
jgi:hypothetical protein